MYTNILNHDLLLIDYSKYKGMQTVQNNYNLIKMDVVRRIKEKEKQKKKMKNIFSVRIVLCNKLFIANQPLYPARALDILLRMNGIYCKGKYKALPCTENEQILSLKYSRPQIAYTVDIMSLVYDDAQVNIFILNIELNNFKINIIAITNNFEPLPSLLSYSAGKNIKRNNEDLLSESITFMTDNFYVTNKKYEQNNSLIYNLTLTAVIMKKFAIIFNKYCEMKIVNHLLFSEWSFQDISVGYLFSAILKSNYFNIFIVNKSNGFAIIRIHQDSMLKLNFELCTFGFYETFTLGVPIFQLHLPITIKAKFFDLNANSKIDPNCYFSNIKNKKYEKQDKSTYVVYKSPKIYFLERGINTERNKYEMETDSQIDIINNNYFEFINSTLWLPYLCGDCYDDKIGDISYILKCSCLDESLLDLDNIERFLREIANILTSMKFYTTALKDLSKYLAYMFIKL